MNTVRRFRRSRSRSNGRHRRPRGVKFGPRGLIALAAAALVVGGIILTANLASDGAATGPPSAVMQLVYTARTSTDGPYELDAATRDALVDIAQSKGAVALVEIDGDGTVDTVRIDLTPRVDADDPDSAAITVGPRADIVIAEKIDAIQTAMNEPATVAGRQLYSGLRHALLVDVPTWVYSQGIDLGAPDGTGLDFNALQWKVPAAEVTSALQVERDVLPAEVSFVFTAPTGDQQLTPETRAYRESVWREVLRVMGSDSITFSTAPVGGGLAAPDGPLTPSVPLPADGSVPRPEVGEPVAEECEVSDTAFAFGSATIADPSGTELALSDCIAAALATDSPLVVAAWASYEGPLDVNGVPLENDPANIRLTEQRCSAVASILGRLAPTLTIQNRPMGNTDLPHPEYPASAANRVVRVYLLDTTTR